MEIGNNINAINDAMARWTDTVSKASNPETANLEEVLVAKSIAKATVGVNIEVLKAAMEMQESLIDLMA
ncbi:MAG: hypothetical protein GF307_08120 [candidate division Zixibacteria bacterium]|nr:hypothetical protein [candidate division Zixibacteria bacterium]